MAAYLISLQAVGGDGWDRARVCVCYHLIRERSLLHTVSVNTIIPGISPPGGQSCFLYRDGYLVKLLIKETDLCLSEVF